MTRRELEARFKQTIAQRDSLDDRCEDLEEKLRVTRLELVQAAITLRQRESDADRSAGSTARLRKPQPSKPIKAARRVPCV